MKKKHTWVLQRLWLYTLSLSCLTMDIDTVSPVLSSLACMNIFLYQSMVRNVMYHTIFILDTVSTHMEDNIELCSKGICTLLKTKDLQRFA